MNHFFRATVFAFHLATPVEGAVAPFHHEHSLSPVAAAAAHEVAPVDADAGVVAGAPVRAGDAEPRVLLAEPGRRLVVHQVLAARRLVVGVVRPQLESVAVAARHPVRRRVVPLRRRLQVSVRHHDPRRAVEAVLQRVAHRAEARQPHPASLHRARARHPVALALLPHLRLHVLRKKRPNKTSYNLFL